MWAPANGRRRAAVVAAAVALALAVVVVTNTRCLDGYENGLGHVVADVTSEAVVLLGLAGTYGEEEEVVGLAPQASYLAQEEIQARVTRPDDALPACPINWEQAGRLRSRVAVTNATFDLARCIPPVCYTERPTPCNETREDECLQWMTHESDCGAQLVPPSPLHDGPNGTVTYHMYWAGPPPLPHITLLSIKSFLVSQPDNARLNLWTSRRDPSVYAFGDAKDVLTHRRVTLRYFNVRTEWEYAIERVGETGGALGAGLALPEDCEYELIVGFSDIVRLLLLYRYGGVYVDMDTLFLRDLSPLLHLAPFAYRWDCLSNVAWINTAVLAMQRESETARRLLEVCFRDAQQLVPMYVTHSPDETPPQFNFPTVIRAIAGLFHPYELTRYVEESNPPIPLRSLSLYLIDPLWGSAHNRAHRDDACIGFPCNGFTQFRHFFNTSGNEVNGDPTVRHNLAAYAERRLPSVIERTHVPVPFCDPVFAFHWHNQWDVEPHPGSQGAWLEHYLDEQLRHGQL